MRWILLAITVFSISCDGCGDKSPQDPFKSAAWKTLPWQERYTMCERLLESRILEGATRERVIEMLGPPNGTRKPDRISYLVRKRWILLVIGEVKVLDIRFDRDDRVSRSFIRGT